MDDPNQNQCSPESSSAESNSCSAESGAASSGEESSSSPEGDQENQSSAIGPPPPASSEANQSTSDQNFTPAPSQSSTPVLAAGAAAAAPLTSTPNSAPLGDGFGVGEAANDNAWAGQAANDNAVADTMAEDVAADTTTDLAADAAGDTLVEPGAGILEVLGAPFVAIGVGVAVFLYPASTEPGWMDARNPITGDFYKSEEEAKQIGRMSPDEIQAKIAERKKKELDAASNDSNAQSSTSTGGSVQTCPIEQASPATDSDTKKPKTCASEHPELNICDGLPAKYRYSSENEAFEALKKFTGSRTLKKGTRAVNSSDGSPCQGQGEHINVRDGKPYAGSIVWCPCCTDTPAGPVLGKRYAVI